MNKSLKTFAVIIGVGMPCFGGIITHTDYTAGSVITAAGQNANENTIVNEFNGNIESANIAANTIVNGDISASAAIAVTKIANGSNAQVLLTSGTTPTWGVFVSSYMAGGTDQHVLITSGSTPTWAYKGIVQSTQCTVVASSASTVTTGFIPTALSCTITPRSASSNVKVSVTGAMSINNPDVNITLSVFRGASDLASPSSNGFVTAFYSISDAANKAPVGITYLDSPATTSATTYSVRMKIDGAGTMTFPTSGAEKAVMLLEEIAP